MLPIVLYDNRYNDGTPAATDSAAGFSVLNIKDMRPYTFWMGASAGVKYLTIDCGTAKTADALAILGHNLGTIGSDAVLQGSSDNFAADITTVVAERAASDKAIVRAARIVPNGGFEVWSNGTNIAPDGWAVTGAGAAIARDAVNFKTGIYGAALTAGGAACSLNIATLLNSAYLAGKTITLGAWVKATAPNVARISLWDDITAAYTSSAYHSGGGGWEFLTISLAVPANATQVGVYLWNEGVAGTVYYDYAVLKIASSVAVTDFSDPIQPQAVSKRYWRIKLTAGSAAPQIAVATIGDMLRLPYPPERPYVPYAEKTVAETATGKTGHPLGAVVRYKSRKISAKFTALTRAFVRDTYAPFWDNHASDLKPFFYAEDLDGYPENSFFVKVPDDEVYQAPISISSLVDEITLNMEGVKE